MSAAANNRLDLLKGIELEVSAEIGSAKMDIAAILQLGTGSIVEFTRAITEPVDLLVNGRVVARGEIIAVDDKLGLRVTELVDGSAF